MNAMGVALKVHLALKDHIAARAPDHGARVDVLQMFSFDMFCHSTMVREFIQTDEAILWSEVLHHGPHCYLPLAERWRNVHLHLDRLGNLSGRSLITGQSTRIPLLEKGVICNRIDALGASKHLIPQGLAGKGQKRRDQSSVRRRDGLVGSQRLADRPRDLDPGQLSLDLTQGLLEVKFFLYVT